MALQERVFGPPSGEAWVYLDTSRSEVVDATAGQSALFIPGEDFVLGASYERLGPDLLLSGEEHSVFVKGYFTREQAPDLYTTDGSAVVRGSVATRLAGPATPGQFAQAEAVPGTAPIGVVDNVEGRVFLSRLDGTNVLAEPGTPVFLGDIVESEGGSNIGITFIDDSTFALGESGRMIIDDLVYDPVDGTGESAFNVLKGVFSFVSGDIAGIGDDAMVVNTPVLSIGVRGTTVAGRAAAEGSANTVTLLPDASGTVGSIAVSNEAGVQVMSQAFQTTTVTSLFQAPPVPVTIPISSVQDLYGDISKVLPPPPATRQQDSGDDSAQAAQQQQEAQPEEQPEEQPEGEAEGEGEEGPEGEAGVEGEELEEGLEEGEEIEEGEDLEAGEEGPPNGEGLPDGEFREGAGPEGEFQEGAGPESEGPRDGEFGPGGPGEEFAAVAEEAYEQALEEGLSAAEAELRARDAVEEAFGEEFGPEGPGGLGPGRPGGEFAEVAEEAFEQALAEGLSREEAGFRARDAVEEAFAEEFGQGDPGDYGSGRPNFGSADEVGVAAGEAF